MKRTASIAVFVPLALALVAADRLSKAWAAANLYAGVAELDLGPVNFTLVHNTGAAFGIGEGSTYVFIAIAACIVTLIVAWLAGVKRHSKLEVLSLALVAAGGVGNLIDRVQWGYVVDFIEFTFIDFPVFNVADVCVTCGVALFIIAVLFCMDFGFEDPDGEGAEGSREVAAADASAARQQVPVPAAAGLQAAADGADSAPVCAASGVTLGAEGPDVPLAAGGVLAAFSGQVAGGAAAASAPDTVGAAPAAVAHGPGAAMAPAADCVPAPDLTPLDVEGVLAVHGKTVSARVEQAAAEARYYDSPASYELHPAAGTGYLDAPDAAVAVSSAGAVVAGPASTSPRLAVNLAGVGAAVVSGHVSAANPASAEPDLAACSEETASFASPEPRYPSVAAELLAELRAGSQGGSRA